MRVERVDMRRQPFGIGQNIPSILVSLLIQVLTLEASTPVIAPKMAASAELLQYMKSVWLP